MSGGEYSDPYHEDVLSDVYVLYHCTHLLLEISLNSYFNADWVMLPNLHFCFCQMLRQGTRKCSYAEVFYFMERKWIHERFSSCLVNGAMSNVLSPLFRVVASICDDRQNPSGTKERRSLLMKKLFTAILALVLVFSLSAVALAEGDLLDTIRERGYLIVGTEGTWSPYTYHDENDELVGFDVEVARIIAAYIGVEVRYTETVWSSIFAALDAGQIDLIVNEVSYTEERSAKYDFSDPYTYAQRAILVRADNNDINGLADISGKTAANDATSTIGQFAQDNGAILDPVGEMAQSINEVLNGRADLTLNNTVAFADYLRQHPESEEKVRIIVATEPAPSGYIPVLKGNEQLVNAVNEALAQAKADGTLSELSVKYFGVDITAE